MQERRHRQQGVCWAGMPDSTAVLGCATAAFLGLRHVCCHVKVRCLGTKKTQEYGLSSFQTQKCALSAQEQEHASKLTCKS